MRLALSFIMNQKNLLDLLLCLCLKNTQTRETRPRGIWVKPGSTDKFWINLFDGTGTEENGAKKIENVQREMF